MKITKRVYNRRGRLWRRLVVFVASLLIATGMFLITKPSNAVPLAEINAEDWKLELIFFDSTVNKGRDPIVNEEWIIPTSTRSNTYNRTITMQVNYRNENVDRNYTAGELQIKVPNPFKNSNLSSAQLSAQVAIGANNASQTAYDWSYNYNNYSNSDFVFTNSREIEAFSNVEGSIQMVYYLTSNSENPEKYQDSCTHSINTQNIKAVLNSVAESNETSFKFSRTYEHAWTKSNYNIKTLASKIISYDNLGENPDQYTWVKYRFYGKSSTYSYMGYSTIDYPSNLLIGLSSFRVRNLFPDDVKLVDRFGNELDTDENGYLQISNDITKSSYSVCSNYSYDTCYELYAGYPIDKYNDDLNTSNITNTVELRGVYSNEDTEGALADSTINLNLNDFKFVYNGGNIGITKTFYGNTSTYLSNYPYYYQNIIREGSTGRFNNTVTTGYNGQKYDLRIGDDIIYYIDEEANAGILDDDKYYFTSVYVPTITNSSNTPVDNKKYPFSVYVRYRNTDEFVKFGDYTQMGTTINFGTTNYVQAWYVEIKGLTEGINKMNYYTYLTIKDTDIAHAGKIYNFDYIDMYINGSPVQLANLENYATGITKEIAAPYDLEHYGHYLQRSVAQAPWEYHSIGTIGHNIYTYINSQTSPTYDPADEYFKGVYRVYGQFADYDASAFNDINLNLEQYKDSDWHREANLYVLLPLGMEPNATEEEVATSAHDCSWQHMYGTDGKRIFNSKKECEDFITEHSTVTFTKNWHNTGRWHVAMHVDYSSKPFTLMTTGGSSGTSRMIIDYLLPYKISYDSYAENGRTYLTRVYIDAPGFSTSSGTLDDGRYDAQEADINGNDNTTERVSYSNITVNLLSATSTSQDLQISVLTDHNGTYDVEDARSGTGEDYSYKLRVRTGPSRVTNVVLYNHIEEAYEDNEYWQGHFDGVDTSYAESKLDNYDKPIRVKVYWSPKTDAGTLKDDDSWEEYNEETVDKTQVRSLAFEYLDPDGNPSILPQASYSYVLVKMRATENEDVNAFTYNSLSSEWNAIDNLTGNTIYNITGLTSNIVRVYLHEDLSLKVKKIWDDYNNYYKKRPDTLTFTLRYDGEIVETKTMNIANGESEVVFENLDILNQDLYTVEEEEVGGYISSAQQNGVTLAYEFTNKIDAPDPALNPKTSDANPWLYVVSGSALLVTSVGAIHFARMRR